MIHLLDIFSTHLMGLMHLEINIKARMSFLVQILHSDLVYSHNTAKIVCLKREDTRLHTQQLAQTALGEMCSSVKSGWVPSLEG